MECVIFTLLQYLSQLTMNRCIDCSIFPDPSGKSAGWTIMMFVHLIAVPNSKNELGYMSIKMNYTNNQSSTKKPINYTKQIKGHFLLQYKILWTFDSSGIF